MRAGKGVGEVFKINKFAYVLVVMGSLIFISNPHCVLGEDVSSDKIKRLTEELSSSDVEVAYKAAWSLGELKNPGIIQPLIETLERTQYEAISNAVSMALPSIESDVAKSLIPLLTHENWSVRKNAVWVLGRLQEKEALPDLIKCLDDKSDWVRLYAAWALGKIADKKAIEPLSHTLSVEKNEAVGEQIKLSLAQIDQPLKKIVVKDAPIWLLIEEQDIPKAGVTGDRITIGSENPLESQKFSADGFEFENQGRDDDNLVISPFLPGVVYLKGSGKITYSETGRSVQFGSIQHQPVKQEVNKEGEINVINIDDLTLQGIFWKEEPKKVIIGDKRTQKSYVLTESESLGEIKVGEITKDKVTLEYRDRKVELLMGK